MVNRHAITDGMLSGAPLTIIASHLSKQDLPAFLLVSKGYLSAGRSLGVALRPNVQITDAQLERLCELFPFIETLDITGCSNLISPGLGYLPCLKSFTAQNLLFELSDTPGSFHNYPQLENMNLGGCEKLTDAALEGLDSCRKLRKLDLSLCSKLTGAAFEGLGSWWRLQKLDFGGCEELTDAALRGLGSCRQLWKLDLGGCEKLTDAALKGLDSCRKLRKLELGDCFELTDTVLPAVGTLTGLRSLGMWGCNKLTAVSPTPFKLAANQHVNLPQKLRKKHSILKLVEVDK